VWNLDCVCGLPFSEIFIDIGLPDDYIELKMKCFSGNHEENMKVENNLKEF
jgi:hypothetical protein